MPRKIRFTYTSNKWEKPIIEVTKTNLNGKELKNVMVKKCDELMDTYFVEVEYDRMLKPLCNNYILQYFEKNTELTTDLPLMEAKVEFFEPIKFPENAQL